MYFFGGIAKLSDDWLSGATWYSLGRSSEHSSAAALINTTSELLNAAGASHGWRTERAAAQLLSWGGAIFDLGVGPLLLASSRPLVWIGVLAATAFHISNLLSFTIGIFPVTMLCTGPFFLGFPSPAMAAALRISAPPSTITTATLTGTGTSSDDTKKRVRQDGRLSRRQPQIAIFQKL